MATTIKPGQIPDIYEGTTGGIIKPTDAQIMATQVKLDKYFAEHANTAPNTTATPKTGSTTSTGSNDATGGIMGLLNSPTVWILLAIVGAYYLYKNGK